MLLPLWLLVLGGGSQFLGVLVIASKQITSITLLVFWIAMGDLLHGRQAKRLFAPMMAGVTLALLGQLAFGRGEVGLGAQQTHMRVWSTAAVPLVVGDGMGIVIGIHTASHL